MTLPLPWQSASDTLSGTGNDASLNVSGKGWGVGVSESSHKGDDGLEHDTGKIHGNVGGISAGISESGVPGQEPDATHIGVGIKEGPIDASWSHDVGKGEGGEETYANGLDVSGFGVSGHYDEKGVHGHDPMDVGEGLEVKEGPIDASWSHERHGEEYHNHVHGSGAGVTGDYDEKGVHGHDPTDMAEGLGIKEGPIDASWSHKTHLGDGGQETYDNHVDASGFGVSRHYDEKGVHGHDPTDVGEGLEVKEGPIDASWSHERHGEEYHNHVHGSGAGVTGDYDEKGLQGHDPTDIKEGLEVKEGPIDTSWSHERHGEEYHNQLHGSGAGAMGDYDEKGVHGHDPTAIKEGLGVKEGPIDASWSRERHGEEYHNKVHGSGAGVTGDYDEKGVHGHDPTDVKAGVEAKEGPIDASWSHEGHGDEYHNQLHGSGAGVTGDFDEKGMHGHDPTAIKEGLGVKEGPVDASWTHERHGEEYHNHVHGSGAGVTGDYDEKGTQGHDPTDVRAGVEAKEGAVGASWSHERHGEEYHNKAHGSGAGVREDYDEKGMQGHDPTDVKAGVEAKEGPIDASWSHERHGEEYHNQLHGSGAGATGAYDEKGTQGHDPTDVRAGVEAKEGAVDASWSHERHGEEYHNKAHGSGAGVRGDYDEKGMQGHDPTDVRASVKIGEHMSSYYTSMD
jgi:hypothetical protein